MERETPGKERAPGGERNRRWRRNSAAAVRERERERGRERRGSMRGLDRITPPAPPAPAASFPSRNRMPICEPRHGRRGPSKTLPDPIVVLEKHPCRRFPL